MTLENLQHGSRRNPFESASRDRSSNPFAALERPSATFHAHHTISQDRTGTNDAVVQAILAPLGDRPTRQSVTGDRMLSGSKYEMTETEFIQALHAMLGDPYLKHIMSWSTVKDSFIIKNSEETLEALEERGFRAGDFPSFLLQLNEHCFLESKVCNAYDESSHDGTWSIKPLFGMRRVFLTQHINDGEPSVPDLIKAEDALTLSHIIPTDRKEQLQFRIPSANSAAGRYTCSWGAREDGMLLVGTYRHGSGQWKKIRDDEELRMEDKMFLEEDRKSDIEPVRTPGAEHLSRRASYLLNVVTDEDSTGISGLATLGLLGGKVRVLIGPGEPNRFSTITKHDLK